jgi:hypothetical protein
MRAWWLALVAVTLAACDDDTVGPGEPLEAPATLTSVSLDGAVALTWADNAYERDPDLFQNYRVYSTRYDLDEGLCGTSWRLEGTTVAPEFVVGALTNGVPRCFTVTAESIDLIESDRSPIRDDTPRPDARNVVVWARQEHPAASGFRFFRDLDLDGIAEGGELGRVESGNLGDIDFSVERDGSGRLWLTPVRLNTTVAPYGNAPVGDLTGIDYAPISGYDVTPIEAVPMWGYVFEMSGGDGFARYGAVRVTHVGESFLILDWAYQTDPGNPELIVIH